VHTTQIVQNCHSFINMLETSSKCLRTISVENDISTLPRLESTEETKEIEQYFAKREQWLKFKSKQNDELLAFIETSRSTSNPRRLQIQRLLNCTAFQEHKSKSTSTSSSSLSPSSSEDTIVSDQVNFIRHYASVDPRTLHRALLLLLRVKDYINQLDSKQIVAIRRTLDRSYDTSKRIHIDYDTDNNIYKSVRFRCLETSLINDDEIQTLMDCVTRQKLLNDDDDDDDDSSKNSLSEPPAMSLRTSSSSKVLTITDLPTQLLCMIFIYLQPTLELLRSCYLVSRSWQKCVRMPISCYAIELLFLDKTETFAAEDEINRHCPLWLPNVHKLSLRHWSVKRTPEVHKIMDELVAFGKLKHL
jgi:hypothetical protein